MHQNRAAKVYETGSSLGREKQNMKSHNRIRSVIATAFLGGLVVASLFAQEVGEVGRAD
jgi:hypothetical protein